MTRQIPRFAVLSAAVFLASKCWAGFDIRVTFSSTDPDPVQNAAYEAAFDWAEQRLESYITGYQPGIFITGIDISARIRPLDGPGNRLGQANFTSTRTQAGYVMPTAGFMDFDVADGPALEELGVLNYLVLHEMAHVMGFGTVWDRYPGLLEPGKFNGENALRAYRAEWDPLAEWVPVETEGGSGTAGRHWDEVRDGADWTNITMVNDPSRDFAYEIMTGWLNYRAYEPIFSRTTVQSFADIGYTVVPEPAGLELAALPLIGLLIFRVRRLASRRAAA